ncbi:MAG TPA: branched chain amino acid aminotransferase [Deltaproteobacteria bacterium]|nr:branched chain amino acid aminotransferase [Deltaproteobacteria bacterium]
MVQKVDKIWLDGKMIPWDEANVHVLTHTLHYGMGVFEGIRCYEGEGGRGAIFRLEEHIDRLYDSAHILLMKIPFPKNEILEACKEIFRVNKLKAGYLRPLVFMGDGEMGLHATSNKIRVAVIAWPWGTYLGDEGVKNGIRAKVSSFTRHHVNVTMTKSKAVANYVNSILAKREAMLAGYEETVMLDTEGYVSEASGENIFLVKKGRVLTPPTTSALQGITRDTVIELLQESGIRVKETHISRDELYIADEIFLTGTAAEITPVRELDDRSIGDGKPGPITRKVQQEFHDLVRGKNKKHPEWLAVL